MGYCDTYTPVTTRIATTTTTTPPPPPEQICWSVGDPHVKQFDGTLFDTHANGWRTLYGKGDLKIEVEQATFGHTPGGVAVNRAVRYSTDGGATWDELLQDGQLLSSGGTKQFVHPNVKLTVGSSDYSQYSWARVPHLYNVYVTTSEYTDATGQCTEGKLAYQRVRLRSRRLVTSDGVSFPSGDDVQVTEQMAEEACAGLGEQRDNCITDLRMVNKPEAVAKITEDYETVESTVETLATTTTTTTTSKNDADGMPEVVVDSSAMTHLCMSVLALTTFLVF